MLIHKKKCISKMWQLTRTFLCSFYEPKLHIPLKYLLSVVANKGHWHLEPPFLVGSRVLLPLVSPVRFLMPASKGHGPKEGREVQLTGVVGQDHPLSDRRAQRQHNFTRTHPWAHLPGHVPRIPPADAAEGQPSAPEHLRPQR